MAGRALQAVLAAGMAIGAANLLYLAERYPAISLLADAHNVVAVPAEGHSQLMQRMAQRCGSYAELYEACENTSRTVAGTMSIAARETRRMIAIEAVASGVMLLAMLMTLVSLRSPGKPSR